MSHRYRSGEIKTDVASDVAAGRKLYQSDDSSLSFCEDKDIDREVFFDTHYVSPKGGKSHMGGKHEDVASDIASR